MSLDKHAFKKSRLMERMTLAEEAAPGGDYARRLCHKAAPGLEAASALWSLDDGALTYTSHAQHRLPQRNLTADQVEYVIIQGTAFHCAGAVIIHLRRKDVWEFDRVPLEAERLIGTTVVLDPSQAYVLTVYRNRQEGMRRLKHKPR